jgi:hypothetical protein
MENGSITSEILVSFLKHMDILNLFPREDGVMPFLLLDGLLEKWEEVKSHGIPHLSSVAASQRTATEQPNKNEE